MIAHGAIFAAVQLSKWVFTQIHRLTELLGYKCVWFLCVSTASDSLELVASANIHNGLWCREGALFFHDVWGVHILLGQTV